MISRERIQEIADFYERPDSGSTLNAVDFLRIHPSELNDLAWLALDRLDSLDA